MKFDNIKLRHYLNKVIIRFEDRETFEGFVNFIAKRSFRWYNPDEDVTTLLKYYKDDMCVMFNDTSEVRSVAPHCVYEKHAKRFKREYGHNVAVIKYEQFKKDIQMNCQADNL